MCHTHAHTQRQTHISVNHDLSYNITKENTFSSLVYMKGAIRLYFPSRTGTKH